MATRKKKIGATSIAPPSSTGGAGPWFEGKVGAFYLLSLLASGEPRGLPGAVTTSVQFQQFPAGRPLDDFTITALNANGSKAFLEIQAKRSLDFTKSDTEFQDVVRRMWVAAQKPEFVSERYELAVAIARTTTRIERACQEVLHWARQLPDGEAFAKHIARKNFASDPMRDFVEVFKNNLRKAGAPTDDDTVWRMLRRFQILVFDFESPGSDYEHRARERARMALAPDQAGRAIELWPILDARAMELARAGGTTTASELETDLGNVHGLRFSPRADLRPVLRKLDEYSTDVLSDIRDDIGGVRLSRTALVEQALTLLEGNRVLQIIAEPGVGKSAILKQFAKKLEPEGRVLAIAPNRIVAGGWTKFASIIGCTVSRDELFNELGCGGGATLFIDNIDQFDDDEDWATLNDLLRAAVRLPGWRVVVTAGKDTGWRRRLAGEVRQAGTAALELAELTDAETAALSEQSPALSALLHKDHPARAIARNLFNLSRLLDMEGASSTLASETDLARAVWAVGGGRNDVGSLARLKTLRAIGTKILAEPGRGMARTDELDSAVVQELLRLDGLKEVRKGSTVAFRHDVLRDWAIGFLLDEEEERIASLPLDKPLPGSLARGIEFAARLAIEADPSGARWLALLEKLEKNGCDGTWRRPVLLALPRSERALALFQQLEAALLADKGRRIYELIKLMMAVESEPLSKYVARAMPSLPIPAGVDGMVVPKGQSWLWLVMWAVARAGAMPDALIPDLTKLFQSWLIITQSFAAELNALIVDQLFKWLARLDDAVAPRMYRTLEEAQEHTIDVPHAQDVREDLRMTCVSFAHLNPKAADGYLRSLSAKDLRHQDIEPILRMSGSLAKAAPAALVDFMLAVLVDEEEDDEDGFHSHRRSQLGPFGTHEHIYMPASPGQGPFFDLLESSPADGLRLIRGLVERATEWRRAGYREASQKFPSMTIPMPDGAMTFEGDFEIYRWARGNGASPTVGSALMALEAWAHRQIEAGRDYNAVIGDVLGPSGSSVAFVAVAVDLALSHWSKSRESVWPFLATPELLQFDHHRHNYDTAGVDRFSLWEREPANMRIKRAELDAKVSRQCRLSDCIGEFTLQGPSETLGKLQNALKVSLQRIVDAGVNDDDPILGLRAFAARALRMTDAQHWKLVKGKRPDGSEVEGYKFQADPEENKALDAERARTMASTKHFNARLEIEAALFKPEKSTPDIVAAAIEWAKRQLTRKPDENDEADDFSKQWDKRAIAMAAALAARDYAGEDRKDVFEWARAQLNASITDGEPKHLGSEQVQYSEAAIATLGFVALYKEEQTGDTLDVLLGLAAHRHPAVQNALGSKFEELQQLNAKLIPSLVRITLQSAVFPRREYDEDEDQKREAAHHERIASAIQAEKSWLGGAGAEPNWPELPSWITYPKRRFRIGGDVGDEAVPKVPSPPELLLDEQRVGMMTGHLVPLTLGDLPKWLVGLSKHLMQWSAEANGPQGDDDEDRDHRPLTWNAHFFDFLGILAVALPQAELDEHFLRPMAKFTDDAFLSAAATFLRGFDRATIDPSAADPEDPVAVREFVAAQIRGKRAFRRLSGGKSKSAETHLADALNAMFYQPSNWGHRGKSYLPDNWPGVVATAPMLTDLVKAAPSSGYLAAAFLGMIETSHSRDLLPFVVSAATAWRGAYGDDAHFWVEAGIGTRLCSWLEKMMSARGFTSDTLAGIREPLTLCLDGLVRAGIAQANAIERCLQSL